MKEIDCELTSALVCPYCGYEERDSWEVEPDDGERECGHCGEEYSYNRQVTVEYSTYKSK